MAATATATSTSTIADLPQLSLLTVFDHLPLLDLFHIDEVCRAWAQLKTAALLRRRQLIIDNDHPAGQKLLEAGVQQWPAESLIHLVKEDGETGLTPYARPRGSLDRHTLVISALRLGGIQPETLDRLTELLPNVVVLRVFTRTIAHSSELWKVKQLLSHYRQQLVEVTVWFWESFSLLRGERSKAEVEGASAAMFTSLMATLGQLKALRRLEVNYQAPPTCTLQVPPESVRLAAVVSGLKSLSFRTCLTFDGPGDRKDRTQDARLLEKILQESFGRGRGVVEGGSANLTPPELYCAGTPLSLRTLVAFGDAQSGSLISVGLRSVDIADVFDDQGTTTSPAAYRALAKFARQAANLEQLAIRLKGPPLRILRKVIEALASSASPNSLCSLVHLKITFAVSEADLGGGGGGGGGGEGDKKREEEEDEEKEEEEDEAKKKPLPVLPSVKSLT